MNRTYSVYKGELKGKIVYIGTTIQNPEDRFRWHKHNGKDLKFTVVTQFDNQEEMLEEEFRLIKKHNPSLNKIKHRKQNLNAPLSKGELNSRRGSSEWCQSCLKRHVSKGYTNCMWCK